MGYGQFGHNVQKKTHELLVRHGPSESHVLATQLETLSSTGSQSHCQQTSQQWGTVQKNHTEIYSSAVSQWTYDQCGGLFSRWPALGRSIFLPCQAVKYCLAISIKWRLIVLQLFERDVGKRVMGLSDHCIRCAVVGGCASQPSLARPATLAPGQLPAGSYPEFHRLVMSNSFSVPAWAKPWYYYYYYYYLLEPFFFLLEPSLSYIYMFENSTYPPPEGGGKPPCPRGQNSSRSKLDPKKKGASHWQNECQGYGFCSRVWGLGLPSYRREPIQQTTETPKPVTRNVPKEDFGKSGEQAQHMGFCLVLKGGSFCKSGPEACQKKCGHRTFWKNGEQVHHLGGLIRFLRALGRKFILQVRLRNLPQEMCARNILEKVGNKYKTWGGLIWFLFGLERGVTLQARHRNLSQDMCLKNILEQSGEQVRDLGGLIWFLQDLEREDILPVKSRSLSQAMCPKNILEKVGSRSKTCGDLFDFRRALKGELVLPVWSEACHKTCAQGVFWKSGGEVQHLWGFIWLCRVLLGRSFYRSSNETCHKKCVQGAFWKKRGASPRPGGTYLIFVGSWKRCDFVCQTPKKATRNVSEERFGKSWEQVQHLGRLIWFLSDLAKEFILQGMLPNLSQDMCPRNILEKVGGRFNTWRDLSDFCGVLQGSSFSRSGPEACHKKCAQETFWKKWGQVQHLWGLIWFLSGPERELILQVRPRNLLQEMCLRSILEKMVSRSNTWGDLSDFCRVLKGRSFCRAGPETCHKKCTRWTFGKSSEQVKHLGGLIWFLSGLEKGRSFCRAGFKTCHKKCAQGTFWKKWGAGPTPGGT